MPRRQHGLSLARSRSVYLLRAFAPARWRAMQDLEGISDVDTSDLASSSSDDESD